MLYWQTVGQLNLWLLGIRDHCSIQLINGKRALQSDCFPLADVKSRTPTWDAFACLYLGLGLLLSRVPRYSGKPCFACYPVKSHITIYKYNQVKLRYYTLLYTNRININNIYSVYTYIYIYRYRVYIYQVCICVYQVYTYIYVCVCMCIDIYIYIYTFLYSKCSKILYINTIKPNSVQ